MVTRVKRNSELTKIISLFKDLISPHVVDIISNISFNDIKNSSKNVDYIISIKSDDSRDYKKIGVWFLDWKNSINYRMVRSISETVKKTKMYKGIIVGRQFSEKARNMVEKNQIENVILVTFAEILSEAVRFNVLMA